MTRHKVVTIKQLQHRHKVKQDVEQYIRDTHVIVPTGKRLDRMVKEVMKEISDSHSERVKRGLELKKKKREIAEREIEEVLKFASRTVSAEHKERLIQELLEANDSRYLKQIIKEEQKNV